jgi:RNA polymerase sigma-70 factor (ECF subfamily)
MIVEAPVQKQERTRTSRSDRELVAACLAPGEGGDAFRELVERHKGMVMACAYGILKDHHEAEDAAQESFVKAYRSLHTLHDPSDFHAWLMTIARNTALTRSTKRRPAPVVQDDRAGEASHAVPSHHDARDAGDDPAATAAQRELHALVLRELDTIPVQYQRAVYFRFVKGLRCSEIAEIEGTGVSVVTSRLSRAVAILREKLAKFTGEHNA